MGHNDSVIPTSSRTVLLEISYAKDYIVGYATFSLMSFFFFFRLRFTPKFQLFCLFPSFSPAWQDMHNLFHFIHMVGSGSSENRHWDLLDWFSWHEGQGLLRKFFRFCRPPSFFTSFTTYWMEKICRDIIWFAVMHIYAHPSSQMKLKSS